MCWASERRVGRSKDCHPGPYLGDELVQWFANLSLPGSLLPHGLRVSPAGVGWARILSNDLAGATTAAGPGTPL